MEKIGEIERFVKNLVEDGLDKERLNKEKLTNKRTNETISQEQLYDLLMSNEVSWQSIIYDLINSGQLNPWDINLALLAQKYLEKIKQLEEASFFISSKVLLAASILLYIKSEILLNEHIRSIDEILFGKKEELAREIERIVLDENEIPELVYRTPLPRLKQVTLNELMLALNKAINTENRRIMKEITKKNAFLDAQIVLPRKKINIRQKIKELYGKIVSIFEKKKEKISYTELAGKEREERIASFLPVLHLDSQEKIWLAQERHLEEIWIWLKEHYEKELKEEVLEELKEEVSEIKEELDNEQLRRIQKINKDFSNPLADLVGEK